MAVRPGNSAQAQLEALLQSADPASSRPERHLWLIALLHWVRAGPQPHHLIPALTTEQLAALPDPVWRVQAALDALDVDAGAHAAVVALLQRFIVHNDATALLADFGFTARPAFWSEFAERLRLKLLPATPDTSDLAALFGLLFPSADDAAWLATLPDPLLARIAALFMATSAHTATTAAAGGEGQALAAQALSEVPTPGGSLDIAAHWRGDIQEAITYSVSQIRAAAFSPQLRRRMRPTSEAIEDAVSPFRQLAAAWEALQLQLQAPVNPAQPQAGAGAAALPQALTYFRALLSACAQAVGTVPEHLEDNGVSIAIVFDATQLDRRIARVETLLGCLLHANAAREHAQMLAEFVGIARRRRSIRALLERNTSLLARKIAERHAATGEQYITRTRSEYRAMIVAAAGGGLAMAFTTWSKLGLLGLRLPLIPSGFWIGANYAATFVLVSLLHWTIATKQPAMTAPAMADKLADLSDRAAVESFVGEVAALIRSQAAGVLGNIALVFPGALVLGLALAWAMGRPVLSAAHAEHEIHALSLLGPTPLFAMLTGFLLFASSVVAGWAENAFVLNRLDSAIRWNPRIRGALGPERAARWAAWWRSQISMMAGNVSLGFFMGLLPALLAGFGIVFAVRHVTLSAGLMGASVATLGLGVLRESGFWWSVAGVVATGFLNVMTSFYLAFRLALRSRGIGLHDRRLLNAALRRQLWRRPLSFVWPPRGAA